MVLKTWVKIAVVCLVVVIIAVVCVQYYFLQISQKAVPEYIPIGMSCDLTGPNSVVEAKFLWGAHWAMDKINAKGGVYVREYDKKLPLKLIYYDDGNDLSRVRVNFETLILKDNVICIVGKGGPAGAQVVCPVAEQYKTPMLTFAMAYEPLFEKSKYVFGLPKQSYEDESQLLFKLITDYNLKTNKKVALVFMDFPDAVTGTPYYLENAPKYGFEIVYHTLFPSGTTDHSVTINTIKSEEADVLIFWGIFADGSTFWRQCKLLGYRPKIAMLILAAREHDWIESMGEDGDYVLSTYAWIPSLPYKVEKYDATSKELAEKYIATGYPTWEHPVAEMADGIFIVAEAIEKAGVLDREAITKALETLEVDLLMGHLKMTRHHLVPQVLACQWQGTERVLVYPKELAEGSIVFPLPPWS